MRGGRLVVGIVVGVVLGLVVIAGLATLTVRSVRSSGGSATAKPTIATSEVEQDVRATRNGRGVVTQAVCKEAVHEVWNCVAVLKNGTSLRERATWYASGRELGIAVLSQSSRASGAGPK